MIESCRASVSRLAASMIESCRASVSKLAASMIESCRARQPSLVNAGEGCPAGAPPERLARWRAKAGWSLGPFTSGSAVNAATLLARHAPVRQGQ
jgi:hypothetical protein